MYTFIEHWNCSRCSNLNSNLNFSRVLNCSHFQRFEVFHGFTRLIFYNMTKKKKTDNLHWNDNSF